MLHCGEWSRNLSGMPISASPILRDFDQDGDYEILISDLFGYIYLLDHNGDNLPGWPQQIGILQKTSPNMGDIDGDGSLEVVVGDNDGKVYAWDLAGNLKAGFPFTLQGTVKSVTRLIDMDDDGAAEILLHAGNSKLYLIDYDSSTPTVDWAIDLQGDIDSFQGESNFNWILACTPTVADLELDGNLEIFVGSTAKKVHGFDANGSSLPGWPQSTGDWVVGVVAITDLDGDDDLEVLAASGSGNADGKGKIYAWDESGNAISGFPVTIDSAVMGSLATGDVISSSPGQEIVSVDMQGNIYCHSNTGALLMTFSTSIASGFEISSPLIIDADGDGELEIIVASQDKNIYIINGDGTEVDFQYSGASTLDSTPAAADIDGDGLIELLYADYSGNLYCKDLTTSASDDHLPAPSFASDPAYLIDAPVNDRDRDLIPDAYERALYGSLAYGADDDADADGGSLLYEWILGTNPNDATDRIKL